MNLAVGILLIWLGSALLWVAAHGLDSGAQGFADIWSQVLAGIGGTP